MPKKKEGQYVDAIFITAQGWPFESSAPWPHENMIALSWEDDEDDNEKLIVEYVYFGTYKNRLIYHELEIEHKIQHLG